MKSLGKKTVHTNHYVDNKLVNKTTTTRVVYQDKRGNYWISLGAQKCGRGAHLYRDGSFGVTDHVSQIRSTSGADLINMIKGNSGPTMITLIGR